MQRLRALRRVRCIVEHRFKGQSDSGEEEGGRVVWIWSETYFPGEHAGVAGCLILLREGRAYKGGGIRPQSGDKGGPLNP